MTQEEKVLQALAAPTNARPSIMQMIEDGHFSARDVLAVVESKQAVVHSPKFLRRLERRARAEDAK